MSIEDAHQALTNTLMFQPGIAGTAIGECDGEPCLKVYVTDETRETRQLIPETFEGFQVLVQDAGDIEARE